jgi:hypothetical protein
VETRDGSRSQSGRPKNRWKQDSMKIDYDVIVTEWGKASVRCAREIAEEDRLSRISRGSSMGLDRKGAHEYNEQDYGT